MGWLEVMLGVLKSFANCVAHDSIDRVAEQFDFLSIVDPGSPAKMAVSEAAKLSPATGRPIQKAQGLAFGYNVAGAHVNKFARNPELVKRSFKTVV